MYFVIKITHFKIVHKKSITLCRVTLDIGVERVNDPSHVSSSAKSKLIGQLMSRLLAMENNYNKNEKISNTDQNEAEIL